ncbi:hypothetical protein C9F11_10260 [Streptomyces sp. YIM 121038]|uniref:hypothetical protein n=1 Tax=Streptomyces sp. YIM 121038 TaxID=2136401 RepID=UPI0011105CBD|nr:hypothetical protein [Streptomyces sp. YIM 121038]QCX75732.1 hypothetical protein C9F11_10260 [Streptomyces sp. YIM 121038]
MSYTHKAVGISPNLFDVWVDIEWTPGVKGVRLSLRQDEGCTFLGAEECPDSFIALGTPSNLVLNDVVMGILRKCHVGADAPDYLEDKETAAWELADYGDFYWVPEKLAK